MITVARGERHVLRVFTLGLPLKALHLGGDLAAPLDAAVVSRLLGAPVDVTRIEAFDVADLAGVGLAGYLIEGAGMAEAQIRADELRLGAVIGPVLVVWSAAFGAAGAELTPDPALTLIGTYAEDVPPVVFEALPTASATGLLPQGKAPMSDARMGGMVALAVLVFLGAFTAWFIWGAG